MFPFTQRTIFGLGMIGAFTAVPNIAAGQDSADPPPLQAPGRLVDIGGGAFIEEARDYLGRARFL